MKASGARTRISTGCAGIFLDVLRRDPPAPASGRVRDFVGTIPMAALVAVMILSRWDYAQSAGSGLCTDAPDRGVRADALVYY